MKILVVSSLYPPHYIGGYELACHSVVEGLRARGHDVKVLTSTYPAAEKTSDGRVYRWLDAELFHREEWRPAYAAKLLRKEWRNQQATRKVIRLFQPDVVYMWKTVPEISISTAQIAQQLQIPCCFFIFDDWLAHWESDHWFALFHGVAKDRAIALGRAVLRPLAWAAGLSLASTTLDVRFVHFGSEYLKKTALQNGKPVENAEVVRWGLDRAFSYKDGNEAPRRLLYAGQVVKYKGAETAVRALQLLRETHPGIPYSLTIAGGNVRGEEYQHELRGLVASFGLGERVHFAGFIPAEEMGRVYEAHDLLIFPSLWAEPFGITILEAMASGLLVVGTGTGGSAEILKNEITGLTFAPGDAATCAEQITRLAEDPALRQALRANAQRMLREDYTFAKTMDTIENSLTRRAWTETRRSACPTSAAGQWIA